MYTIRTSCENRFPSAIYLHFDISQNKLIYKHVYLFRVLALKSLLFFRRAYLLQCLNVNTQCAFIQLRIKQFGIKKNRAK